MRMSVEKDNEVYLTVTEASQYLSISAQTLRVRAKAVGVLQYHMDISPNIVYYKRSDLDRMKSMKPVERDEPEK